MLPVGRVRSILNLVFRKSSDPTEQKKSLAKKLGSDLERQHVLIQVRNNYFGVIVQASYTI